MKNFDVGFFFVDPLVNLAPAWNGYRYAFDNPVLYSDPNGLFESKSAARKYRRTNGGSWWKGDKINKQEDGSYQIENNKTGLITFEFTDADGDKSIIQGGTTIERGLRISEIGISAALKIEQRNPNVMFINNLREQSYIWGHKISICNAFCKSAFSSEY